MSKLKLLVPSIGTFFTPLRLTTAFHEQDQIRRISSRRFVPPSFNDVRAILNTAQVLSLVKDTGPIELVTFDGDVSLPHRCLLWLKLTQDYGSHFTTTATVFLLTILQSLVY